MLPVKLNFDITGLDGNEYFVSIEIYETENYLLFPEGVIATFRLFEIMENEEREIIYLIDNHAPYGFHEHNQLPENHEARNQLLVNTWQEAWKIFQAKYRGVTK